MTVSATTLDGTRAAALRRTPVHAIKGFLIGLAELLPGISGGTIALVTGVYERLIEGASHVVRAFRLLLAGPDRVAGFRTELRRVDWWLALPLLAGMVTAVLTVAGAAEHMVSTHPELARGLFFGLVAASVVVPLRMMPRVRATVGTVVREVATVLVPAVLAFLSVGLAGGGIVADPPPWGVFLAAAVAVCALVVPGLSGSFLLLAVGLYSPTLQAVHERDLGYIAVFGAGALVGLVTVVQLMRALLARCRRGTLLVMTGLMIGSLRALWPWQHGDSGTGGLAAPYQPVAGPILLAVLGAAVVLGLIAVEAAVARRSAASAAAPVAGE